jgi:hypothetical protein
MKPNYSNIINGIFELLNITLKGEITEDKYKKAGDIYIKYVKTDPTINNKRVCKTPFFKWYNWKLNNILFNFQVCNKNLIN